jgi:hypothetical protein
MRSVLVSSGLALLLLSGCNNAASNSSNTSSSTPTSNSAKSINTSGAPKTKGDFSTPKAAVETFFAAGANRDADLISQCFAAESPGEFRKLREKTASEKELGELATFVQGAKVLDVKEKGDTALVSVK